jgi:hypothetical protein
VLAPKNQQFVNLNLKSLPSEALAKGMKTLPLPNCCIRKDGGIAQRPAANPQRPANAPACFGLRWQSAAATPLSKNYDELLHFDSQKSGRIQNASLPMPQRGIGPQPKVGAIVPTLGYKPKNITNLNEVAAC